MKKIRNIFIAFFFLGLIFPVVFVMTELGMFSKHPEVEIKNTVTNPDASTLRVVADFDFAPYSFYDKTNKISGLNVELINEIANQLGMKSQITFTDWPACKRLLQEKKADLILGLEVFSHMNGVLKTVPTSADTLIIFGKDKINNIAELKGKRVGLMVNSVIKNIFDLNCEFVEYYTNTNILEAIESGKIDYGICHHSVGMKIIEKNSMDLVSSAPLMNSFPAVGVRDDLPELRDKINDIIIKMSNDGFLVKLDKKWLQDFLKTRTLKDAFIKLQRFFIIYFVFFIAIIFLFVLILINLYHREQEYKKSIEYHKNLQKEYDILSSIAGGYHSMHIINLKDNTVREISTSDHIKEYVNKSIDAREQMSLVMKNTVIPEDVNAALFFTNLNTVAERLNGKKMILAEFRGTQIGWFCAQFIPTSYQNGEIEEVMFTTQIIDEMKKEKEQLIKLSSYDSLTKLLNRHSYEEKIAALEEKNVKKLTIGVFDINELKGINDNIGHIAGDEIIMGSAKCLESAFSEVGDCYRVGGDEFILVVEKELPDFQKYVDKFNKNVSDWKGKYVGCLHVSQGYATLSEVENCDGDCLKILIETAEKRMYDDKSEFYRVTGKERRK